MDELGAVLLGGVLSVGTVSRMCKKRVLIYGTVKTVGNGKVAFIRP